MWTGETVATVLRHSSSVMAVSWTEYGSRRGDAVRWSSGAVRACLPERMVGRGLGSMRLFVMTRASTAAGHRPRIEGRGRE